MATKKLTVSPTLSSYTSKEFLGLSLAWNDGKSSLKSDKILHSVREIPKYMNNVSLPYIELYDMVQSLHHLQCCLLDNSIAVLGNNWKSKIYKGSGS